MKTGVFIGRFQPLHEGHKACIRKILDENDRCVVLIRDTKPDSKNPFSVRDRVEMIYDAFPNDEVMPMVVPDYGCDLTVYIGRDVGYDLIQLSDDLESISATDIRKELYG